MPYRQVRFDNFGVYHIFNRGVNKQQVFNLDRDYERFLETLTYYQHQGPKPRFSNHQFFKIKDFSNNPKIIEIICYCLMPNHFHLLIRQLEDGGISEFMRKIGNSYTKYHNVKHRRNGPLFQGEFKAVAIESDEQLLHVSRYIHLNPFVADLTKILESYKYSSYPGYLGLNQDTLSSPKMILDFFKNPLKYKEFVDDHADYAYQLGQIKHTLFDLEN